MLTWIGVSWRTASSARRAGLRKLDSLVQGSVAVHTCARDAWLVQGDPGRLVDELSAGGLSEGTVDERSGPAGVEHFFRVAVGLDSAVQGEADVGRQVRAALETAGGRIPGVLDHVLARLLRDGRREGWVREGHGVAGLAVRTLAGRVTIGVVGAGLVGGQVARALGDCAAVYNRTLRPGTRPLAEAVPADAWVVATAAASAWFHPPEPFRLLVDLGHPAQALDDPRRISLDALLTNADARLSPDLLASAERAVRCAVDDVFARLDRREPTPARVSA